MPEDDWALGQNEVDVRNDARRARIGGDMPVGGRMSEGENGHVVSAAGTPERTFPTNDLTDAVEHLRSLNETPAINEDAEQRRQESISRTLDEIQRLMDA